MYSWRSKWSDKFWLIFNYSKVVWDINTKFSPVSVLIRFQLFTKFERHSLKNEAAMPLTIKNFSRAWQGHFLSQALQTWQICFFFVDVQMILLSYLDTSDCLEIEKNEKAFHSSCSELLVLIFPHFSIPAGTGIPSHILEVPRDSRGNPISIVIQTWSST